MKFLILLQPPPETVTILKDKLQTINNNNQACVPKFFEFAMNPHQTNQDQTHVLFSIILFYPK